MKKIGTILLTLLGVIIGGAWGWFGAPNMKIRMSQFFPESINFIIPEYIIPAVMYATIGGLLGFWLVDNAMRLRGEECSVC